MRLVMKPGDSLMTTTSLPMRLPTSTAVARRIVIGLERAHDFQQLHLVNGIKEVHADALRRAIGDAGNFGDAQRRRVRSQDGCGPADFVEQSEDLDLRFHLLWHGFDDQIGFARRLLRRTPHIPAARKQRRPRPAVTLPSSTALSRLARISVSALRRAVGSKSSRMVR